MWQARLSWFFADSLGGTHPEGVQENFCYMPNLRESWGYTKASHSVCRLTEFTCGGRIDGAECELGTRRRLTDGAPTPPTALECGTCGCKGSIANVVNKANAILGLERDKYTLQK